MVLRTVTTARNRAVVANQRFHQDIRLDGAHVGGGDEETGRRVVGWIYMNGIGLEQPDGTVQAAVDVVQLAAQAGGQAVIGVQGVVVHPHGQHVVPAKHGGAGGVEVEARVGPSVLPQMDAVAINIGDGRRAVKAQKNLAAPVRFGEGKAAAVPGRLVGGRVVSAVPGVRHGHGPPFRVLIIRLFGVDIVGLADEFPGAAEGRERPLRRVRRKDGLGGGGCNRKKNAETKLKSKK